MGLPVLSLASCEGKLATGGQSASLWQRRGLRSRPQPVLSLAKEQRQVARFCGTDIASEYAVVGAVGQGTTSSVQHAIRQSDGQHVALKTMRTVDPEMVAIGRQEFDLLSSLEHPNIVRPLDFVDAPGRAVLVMEYFEGVDLLQTLRSLPEGRLPEHLAMPLIAQLSAAVRFLHTHRVVHRDIKPQNVLISKDLKHLKLIDFNVAHSLQEGQALTPTGTRLYAAPEVVLGESPSELSDVWAVGLCAYLLLSGKLPQGRDRCESDMDSLVACASRTACLRGPRWTQVSEPCRAAVLRALAIEPGARGDVLSALAAVQPSVNRLSREMLDRVSKASAGPAKPRSSCSSSSSASTCPGESEASAASRSSSPEP